MSKRYHCPTRTVLNVTKLLSDRCYYDIETIIRNRLQTAPQFIKRLELDVALEGHNGCVNCLEWTSNGRLLASASDDCHVIIWDPFKQKQVLDFLTPHHGNIFSVKFLPNSGDSMVATGAADGQIYVFDINRTDVTPHWKCNCHYTRVKRLATATETPFIFWSAAEDGNVLQFDIREPHKCRSDDKVLLIGLQNHIGPNAEAKCIAINQRRPELIAVGANDVYARIYDRRMISLAQINYKTHDQFLETGQTERQLEDNLSRECVTYYCPGDLNKFKDRKSGTTSKAITYLTFSPDGNELLVNMGAEHIYLYDINNAKQPVYLSMPQFNKSTDAIQNGGTSDSLMPVDPYESSTSTGYNKSTKLPEHVEAIKRMGNDFLENEKYLKAIYQYTTSINIIPNHPVFYLNRATAYMRRNWYGDIYAGLRDCHKALKLDPSYVKAHFRLARALFELGFVDEASHCLDELKNRFPSHANNNTVAMLTKEIQIEQNKEDSQNINESPSPELSESEMHWRTLALDYAERFVGHCNTTTDIKEANFFGSDGNYVIAGSDDGNFFIWERPTNMITNVYKGDMAIVNCVQPNPFCCMLATSGIDHEVRIWSPRPEENFEAKNIIENYDSVVLTNQHRMQADPFDLTSSGTICRSS